MRIGRLLSWPAPQEWVGHTRAVHCTSYSPDGIHVATGSRDKTIRIWDAETGAVVREPLVGHTKAVISVAYSRDGRYIISGSADNTIRIWDAKTGTAVGQPLVGHNDWVASVACSPDGRHIISGSADETIRIWDAETAAPVERFLKGHIEGIQSLAYSPDPQQTGSSSSTIQVSSPTPQPSTQKSFRNHPDLCSPPNAKGWVSDSKGGLLYWVPPDCRTGLHSPALRTIPPTSHFRSVSLDFKEFAFGTCWTQIFNTTQP